MKARVQEEKDKDLISKIINFKKNYHQEIEAAKMFALQTAINFIELEPLKKLRIGLILFLIGIMGFIVSYQKQHIFYHKMMDKIINDIVRYPYLE